jgi:hypothetical protein
MVAGKLILKELSHHAPFTLFGALTGVLLIALSASVLGAFGHEFLFHTLHVLHLFLSAIVTTAIYRKYERKTQEAILVGFFGSVGICTLSDIIFPYLGGRVLRIPMSFHFCLVEHPWLVLPGTFLGVWLGFHRPGTELPHAGHVLVSTYASAFYLTSFGTPASWISFLPLVFPLLFVAVWLPCCTSDFIFPLLFVQSRKASEDRGKVFP